MVSRMVNLHGHIKTRLETLGFENVTVTGVEKDGLNMLINELKPRIILMGCKFYSYATPFMMADLHKCFPKQNFAALSVTGFPAKRAMDFIINGVKSYINLLEGYEQFYKGLDEIRDGKEYISPEVQGHIDKRSYQKASKMLTEAETEITRLLANGFKGCEVADVLHISERTVDTHKSNIFSALKVRNEVELVRMALYLKIISQDELDFYNDDYPLKQRLRKKAKRKKERSIA